MLYLPPRYAHDGVAVGECMTCSIGFRAPQQGELARELLQRLADDAPELAGDALYRDPHQPATLHPAEIPAAVQAFAREAILRVLQDPQALARTLGELLTEPKSEVWFEGAGAADGALAGALRLDRRTKMMFDAKHVFINGEAFRAGGKDATLIRLLADQRRLSTAQARALSAGAQGLMQQWMEAGWVHGA